MSKRRVRKFDQRIRDVQQSTDALMEIRRKIDRAMDQGDKEKVRRLMGDLSFHLSHLDSINGDKDIGLFQFDFRDEEKKEE